jgi:hypothetical protein
MLLRAEGFERVQITLSRKANEASYGEDGLRVARIVKVLPPVMGPGIARTRPVPSTISRL